MKYNNFKYSFFFIFCIFFLTASSSYGQTPTIGYQICSIRWLFCGAVRATLCAVAVIGVGFGVLAGRMQWSSALVILMGMLLFANAEYFAMMFTANPRCLCAPITLPAW